MLSSLLRIALQDLGSCVEQLLIHFYKTTKKKLSRLIIYRDGVLDGQSPEVMRSEVPQVIAACRSLGQRAQEHYSPPVSGPTPPSLSRSSNDMLRRSGDLVSRFAERSRLDGPSYHTDPDGPACS